MDPPRPPSRMLREVQQLVSPFNAANLLPSPSHNPDMSVREDDGAGPAAPASPSSRPDSARHLPRGHFETLGQLSYAPATQTTVVTTTTTTTTSFPPLMIKGPRNLQARDPKQYPLAATPTPPGLKRFCFDVDGKPAWFREADDPVESLKEIKDQQFELQASNGYVQKTTHIEPHFETPTAYSRSLSDISIARIQSTAKRLASPVSLPASKRNSQTVLSKRRRETSEMSDRGSFIPTTPDAKLPLLKTRKSDDSDLFRRDPGQSWTKKILDKPSRRAVQQETPVTLSPTPKIESSASASGVKEEEEEDTRDSTPERDFVMVETQVEGPVTPTEQGMEESVTTTTVTAPVLAPIDTTAGLDASLPSPSLSPVTAALSHANGSGFFDSPDTDEGSSFAQSPSSFDQDESMEESIPTSALLQRRLASRNRAGFVADDHAANLMDLPYLVESFDAMPPEIKNYLMYQFLRRCSKNTLQLVAGVVNPALKCDFLELLPLELSLHIIGFLDVKSLCAAAQVSRKWRTIVNTAEAVWKNLFDRDDFVLAEGELQRSIQEGWGWQDPHGHGEWEQDIRHLSTKGMSPELSSSPESSKLEATPSRPKRKAAPKFNTTHKRKTRRTQIKFSDPLYDASDIERPYTAADAASKAVVNPMIKNIDPSFRQMHLYKSLYRRHYIMRNMWTQKSVKPKHISFRAHSGHVVTCLQFDEDKILTGSDDANINVYDANTGALRKTLTGHEGGVWALQYIGNTLVSGSTDRTVRVWDIERGKCVYVCEGHTSTVRCLQILTPTSIGKDANGEDIMMPSQPLIITGSRDSTLRIWKLPSLTNVPANSPPLTASGHALGTLTGHQQSVRAIAAHGDTLVSGSYDCTVRVWRISTRESIHRLTGHSMKVYSIVLDHKRNRCISGSMDNTVRIWSLDSGQCLFTLEGHTSLVGLLDLRSELLVSAAADSTLRIWNPENGACQHILQAHTAAITCFQHDGFKVISGSDRTLKMWDARTGEFVKDLLTDLSGGWQIRFNDRKCVAAVQRDSVTFIEVLDFGAARYGEPLEKLGRRIIVDENGHEIPSDHPSLAPPPPINAILQIMDH